MKRKPRRSRTPAESAKTPEDFQALSQEIVHLANQGSTRPLFLKSILQRLLMFSGCDVAELWILEGDDSSRLELARYTSEGFSYEVMPREKEFPLQEAPGRVKGSRRPATPRRDRSVATLRIQAGEEVGGTLKLKRPKRGSFQNRDLEGYKAVSDSIGFALLNQRSQADLRERIKELTCLYSIAKEAVVMDRPLEEFLRQTAGLLPSGWQYPELASSRITLDGQSYASPGFREGGQSQHAEIRIHGAPRGTVEVRYHGNCPTLDEGPFLAEERNLINAVAVQIGMIIEIKEADRESARLQEQLRHADRLATIGQLAAGVAHELNEPLGSILGFAQLIRKSEGLSEQLIRDIEKIITGSLHARDVVRNLLTFARQAPSKKSGFDLNQLAEESISFFELRCSKEGIELVKDYSKSPLLVEADRGQINQVVINLVANSIQAMPRGGRLTLETRADQGKALISVKDTGEGMSEQVRKRIFIPFFTTKGVGQGTGLGLSVAYGIVTSHGGEIRAKSSPGEGACFEVSLPLSAPEKAEDHEES